jgi:hypothetical protein
MTGILNWFSALNPEESFKTRHALWSDESSEGLGFGSVKFRKGKEDSHDRLVNEEGKPKLSKQDSERENCQASLFWPSKQVGAPFTLGHKGFMHHMTKTIDMDLYVNIYCKYYGLLVLFLFLNMIHLKTVIALKIWASWQHILHLNWYNQNIWWDLLQLSAGGNTLTAAQALAHLKELFMFASKHPSPGCCYRWYPT